MTHRPDTPRVCSESEYQAARLELGELLQSAPETSDERRVDELIALIERYDATARFVPDWSGEPYANAA
jgi:hypothetical protein